MKSTINFSSKYISKTSMSYVISINHQLSDEDVFGGSTEKCGISKKIRYPTER